MIKYLFLFASIVLSAHLRAQQINMSLTKSLHDEGIPDRFNLWDETQTFVSYPLGTLWNSGKDCTAWCDIAYDGETYYLFINMVGDKGYYIPRNDRKSLSFFQGGDGSRVAVVPHDSIPYICSYEPKSISNADVPLSTMGLNTGTFREADLTRGQRLVHTSSFDYYRTAMLFTIPDIDSFLQHDYNGCSLYDGQIVYESAGHDDKVLKRFNSRLKKVAKKIRRQRG